MNSLKKALLILPFTLILTGCSPQYSNSNQAIQTLPSPTPSEANQTLKELLTKVTIKVPETKFTVVLSADHPTMEYGDHDKNPYAGFGSVTMGKEAVKLGANIFSTIAVNNGGSGEFFYLAAFAPVKDGWLMVATAPLADRIQFETLTAPEANTVQVKYLDHGPNQAMVDMPNVAVTRTYTFKNNKLILLK